MRHRLRQGWTSLILRNAAPHPAPLADTPRTARLFSALAPHDRRHLVAVHRACVGEGVSLDVAMAGLLHDIGKASLSRRRVMLVDRVVRVTLARWQPNLLSRLCAAPAPGRRLGLVLADGHAGVGADRLAALGWSGPIVAAVRNHESDTAEGELATLRRIDDATA